MLSHSDDNPPLEEELEKEPSYPRVKIEPTEEEKHWLEEQLGLNEVLYLKKGSNNTKNVLRNFGNAQNQYILYHHDAINYAHERLVEPENFYRWVRSLKL